MNPTKSNLISFVIPAYNCANTVGASIDSIFNGNISAGDEVIIVNDASTDDTEKILNTIKQKYPIIRIITNSKNIGCPASRNAGIRQAKNPLIFNLDSDDVLVPGSINKLRAAMEETGADITAFGESHFFTLNTKKISHKWIYKAGFITASDILAGHRSPAGNMLYTKLSWEKIGGYWEYGNGLHEFWGFSLKQLLSGSKMFVLKDTYYLHRVGHKSLFKRETEEKKYASSEMATKIVTPYLKLMENKSVETILNNPTWYDSLEKNPIKFKGQPLGQTGTKVVYKMSIFDRIIRKVNRLYSAFFKDETQC